MSDGIYELYKQSELPDELDPRDAELTKLRGDLAETQSELTGEQEENRRLRHDLNVKAHIEITGLRAEVERLNAFVRSKTQCTSSYCSGTRYRRHYLRDPSNYEAADICPTFTALELCQICGPAKKVLGLIATAELACIEADAKELQRLRDENKGKR